MIRAAEPPANQSAPRLLFLDPSFLKETSRARLEVNPAQRREVVIRPDRPWEGLMISFYLTLLDEGDRLRLWYICRDQQNRPNVAYAESKDGINWLKPNLGIVDYNGSRENNLVGLSSLEGVVFRDPKAPPAETYAYVALSKKGLVRYFSPDGLHWQQDPTVLMPFMSDTQNVTFWDERIGAYVLYLRGWDGSGPTAVRSVVRTTLPTLREPSSLKPLGQNRPSGRDGAATPYLFREIPTVLQCDASDPARTDIYNISAQPYPLDPSWYVGFPSFLRRTVASFDPSYKGSSRGPLEVQFVGSHDGVNWARYDRAAYAAGGVADPQSKKMVFLSTGLAVRGDEIWQYGTEFESEHGDVEARKRKTDGVIVRYVQRVDGFVSLDFGNDEGVVRTIPIKISGDHFLVNVNTGALGEVRFGLLGPDGKPRPNFSAQECDPIQNNSLGAVVSWKGQSELTSLAGQSVSLEIRGTRAKLYSLRFASAPPAK